MRMRLIKPGIMSNEVLCDLGPYAYILFTGLWMLADREGRLEYRPKRIKALAMPLWSEVDAEAVENLLENLCKSGFILVYEVAGIRYIQIATWCDHQHPDPREAKSKLPPPPPVNHSAASTSEVASELHCQDNGTSASSRVGNGILGKNEEYVANEDSSLVVQCSVLSANAKTSPPLKRERKTPTPLPPPEPPPPAPPHHPKRKPVVRETRSSVGARKQAAARGEPAHRAPRNIADWWPHKPVDVALIRDVLNDLAMRVRMPPPDEGILRQVLDAARGAPGADIHAVLVALYKRNKFRAMYSWGFVPLVLEQWFRAA